MEEKIKIYKFGNGYNLERCLKTNIGIKDNRLADFVSPYLSKKYHEKTELITNFTIDCDIRDVMYDYIICGHKECTIHKMFIMRELNSNIEKIKEAIDKCSL